MNIFMCSEREIKCLECQEVVDSAGGCGCLRKRCICGALISVHNDGKFEPTNCNEFKLAEENDHFP
jgi:hypothetical protein